MQCMLYIRYSWWPEHIRLAWQAPGSTGLAKMDFSANIVLLICLFLIALITQEAYSLSENRDVDILILTGATTNLRQHLSKPALGDVEPKLRSLVDGTETIDRKWHSAVQDQGSALQTSIQTVERSWAKTDISQLQKSINEATSAFKNVGSDVINLRSEAHVVTEAARGRSQQMQTEANSLLTSVEAKTQEQTTVQGTINSINTEIGHKETAARELDDAAHEAKRKAKKKKKRGLLGAVIGFVAAPFTGGASLALAAAGVGEIKSAEDAFDKARDLRNSATAQRNQIPGLQAQVDSYQQEKSRLETDLHNKRQELETVQGFVRDVDLVETDLNTFNDLLNTAVGYLQNFEVALKQISQTADTMEIVQSIMTENCSSGLAPAALDVCNNQVGNWRGIRGFLGSLKTLKENSQGSIHDEF